MSSDHERYAAYKDSGVEWIGEIPAGWRVERLKWLGETVKGSGIKRENLTAEGFPCVRYGELYTTYGETIKRIASHLSPGLFELSPVAYPGDVLIALTGENEEDIGRATVNLSGEAIAFGGDLLAIRQPKADGLYLSYSINSEYFNRRRTAGARGGIIVHLPEGWVSNSPAIVPPLDEQRAIAAYLDEKTAEIDGLIADTERSIELLQEYRTSVISEAVTKGLDPDAPMKDSGVEWIGEIPAHWEVRRIVNVARRLSGHTPDKKNREYWDGGDIVWVSLADSSRLRNQRYISESTSMTNAAGIAHSSAEIIPAGAVLLSRDASIGLCAIAGCTLAVSQHFMAYVCGDSLLNEYLLDVLHAMQQELEKLSMGSTIPTIGLPLIKNLVTPLPPLNEQEEIERELKKKTAAIDSLIADKRAAIDRLREYRKSLISEAVTGAFKVPS